MGSRPSVSNVAPYRGVRECEPPEEPTPPKPTSPLPSLFLPAPSGSITLPPTAGRADRRGS